MQQAKRGYLSLRLLHERSLDASFVLAQVGEKIGRKRPKQAKPPAPPVQAMDFQTVAQAVSPAFPIISHDRSHQWLVLRVGHCARKLSTLAATSAPQVKWPHARVS